MIVIDHAALHGIAERVFAAAGSDRDEARDRSPTIWSRPIYAAMTATASA